MSLLGTHLPHALLASGKSVADLLGGTGSVPPSSYERLVKPLHEIANGWLLLDLTLGIVFALACAAALAWHPHRLRTGHTLERLSERRILLVISLLGVLVAELVAVEPSMALVIFGIGGLIRFRTVLESPEITAKGIIVVVIGLACGLSLFPLAIFLTAAAWLLLWFIDRTVGVRLRLDFRDHGPNVDAVELALRANCAHRGYRLLSLTEQREGRRLEVELMAPVHRSPETVVADVRSMLPPEHQDSRITTRERTI